MSNHRVILFSTLHVHATKARLTEFVKIITALVVLMTHRVT